MKEKNICKKLSGNYLNDFSHIYIERGVLDHPVTQKIVHKFPDARTVVIDHYADVFNRPRQNGIVQKRSRKLVLAKKEVDFIYRGSELCENFGEENFYYSSSILNCIYDCDYCYLQGMYTTGNVVMFVNLEDYFAAVDALTEDQKIYLCLSYDSDLLAFENITGFTNRWIDYAAGNANLLAEIRTKSANFSAIAHRPIPDNVILAWTLSPQAVITQYEFRTPSLEMRLKSIKQAIARGLKVRLSFEPIMMIEDFERIYGDFMQRVFEDISPEDIRDINIGVFRMSKEHFKRMDKLKGTSRAFAYPMHCVNGYVSYRQEEKLKQLVTEMVPGAEVKKLLRIQ